MESITCEEEWEKIKPKKRKILFFFFKKKGNIKVGCSGLHQGAELSLAILARFVQRLC